MTADREVLRTRLIDAMRAGNRSACDCDDCMGERLDAALALCSPCQTCGGAGASPRGSWDECPTCEGTGDGSVPVLVEYLMEQVGAMHPNREGVSLRVDKWNPPSCVPVWVYKENRDQ